MGRKVFLIDDDPDDRDLFCEAWQAVSPDVKCQFAINGKKAISDLDNTAAELPSLIFLDINMPMMNGWECLSFLKQHEVYKGIPVIMYSTTAHKEEVNKAQKLGALCFFTKPSNYNQLKKSLGLVTEYMQHYSLSRLINSSSLFMVPESVQD